MQSTVSIIVPVYNAEKYLERCIKSLISQTLNGYEIILINDGSRDGSGEIIDRYAGTYSNIIALHQVNRGVSAARNKGILHAKGDYVGFVDADDWVEPDMFERLYLYASDNNCDIVACNYEYSIDGKNHTTSFDIPKNVVITKKEIQSQILKYLLMKSWFSSVWNKLYKRSFILNINNLFEEGRSYSEDFLFNFHALAKADSFYYLDYTGYHYFENYQSATHCNNENLLDNNIKYYKMCLNLVNNLDMQITELYDAISYCLLENCISTIYQYVAGKAQLSIIQKLKRVSEIVNNVHVQSTIRELKERLFLNNSHYYKCMIRYMQNRRVLRLFLCVCYYRWKSDIYSLKAARMIRTFYLDKRAAKA